MRFRTLAFTSFLALASSVGASPQGGQVDVQRGGLTLERLVSLPSMSGTPPRSLVWSSDGTELAFLWNDEGWPFRELFVFDTTDSELRRLTSYSSTTDTTETTGTTGASGVPSRDEERRRGGGISETAWSPDGNSLVFVYDGFLRQIGSAGAEPRSLVAVPPTLHSLELSPDGRLVSFLADGDLWLWHHRARQLVRATRLGESPIGVIPGALFSRFDVELSSYAWSPDSRFLALHFDDRRAVRREVIPDYTGEATRVTELRRDYPSDTDHVRKLTLYDVERGRLRDVEVGDSARDRIQEFHWSPSGDRLLVDVSSEDAVDRWLYLVDPDDDVVEVIWHDEDPRRVTLLGACAWRSDGGGVLFVAGLDGRHHVHALTLPSRRVGALTGGDWSVVAASGPSVLDVSPDGFVYFVSTRKSPYERHVERVSQDGGPISSVTSLEGVHRPYLSPRGRRVALIHSSDTEPPDLFVADPARRGSESRVTRSPLPEFYDVSWLRPRYVSFPSHVDGTTLHGRLLLPPELDPGRKYPVIMGPVYSNTVRRRWGDRQEWRGLYSLFQQYLALERGYIGFHVDVRGSVGYGRSFHERLLLDYGGIDVDDLLSGAKYLEALPDVDGARIGIWGSSYGGLLTLLSLFRYPGVYRAGAAAAPVTDFRHVTTGIAAVMRTREAYPEAHRKGSAVEFGQNLRDPLMILHGMQDSIVLFKDSVVMAEKLMKLGKDFDWVVSPTSTHRWSEKDYVARHFLRQIERHFDRHLRRLP